MSDRQTSLIPLLVRVTRTVGMMLLRPLETKVKHPRANVVALAWPLAICSIVN